MEKIPVTCAGCGKVYEFEVDRLEPLDQHTFIAKCSCGATTQIEAGDGVPSTSSLKDINEFLGQIPGLLSQYRQSRASGADTGIGEAFALVAKEMALEILKTDEKLQEALRKVVRQNLEMSLRASEPTTEPPCTNE